MNNQNKYHHYPSSFNSKRSPSKTNQWLLGLCLSCYLASTATRTTTAATVATVAAFTPNGKIRSTTASSTVGSGIGIGTSSSTKTTITITSNIMNQPFPLYYDSPKKMKLNQRMTTTALSVLQGRYRGDRGGNKDDKDKNKNDENDNDDDETKEVSSKKERKKGNFLRRFGSKNKKSNESNDDNNSNEKTGFFGNVSKALKRIPRKKDESELLDPSFSSEVTLGIEIRRQKALDRYEIGDEIPNEFLPSELLSSSTTASTSTEASEKSTPSDQINLKNIVLGLDESIFYMEKQIQMVRMDERKYKGEIIPGVLSDEEKRLSRLKRDLEAKRKNVILDDQKIKKMISREERAVKDKARIEATRAKAEARALEKKGVNGTAINGQVKDEDKTSSGEKDGDKSSSENAEDSTNSSGVGKNLSNAVDGVVSGAQSALTNVWKTVRNDRSEWITVCPKTRISPGEVFPAVAGGVDLLVIGSKDGTKIHCIANTCPHLGTPLETGMIERRKCGTKSNTLSNSMSTEDDTKEAINDGFEDCIVCPLHQTAFSLDNGDINGDWCPYPPVLGKVMGSIKTENKLPTFKMRTRGKNIEIQINSSID